MNVVSVLRERRYSLQMTYVLLFQISRRSVSHVVELIKRVVSDAIVAAISGEMAMIFHVK